MSELNAYLDRLGIRIFSAHSAYGFWRAIKQNIDLAVGKSRAEKNVNILNKYKLFFKTVQFCLETTFIIELYKFFDKRKDVLKLVEDDSYEPGIAKNMITKKSKIDIENIVKANKPTIDQIKILRKNLFAHDKKNKDILLIPSVPDLDKLFEGVRNICKIISNETGCKINEWPDQDGKEKNQLFVQIIDDLEKGVELVNKEIAINQV